MKLPIVIALLLSTTFSSVASAGLKIYYIRHAQGGHNVEKAWKAKDIPKSEWPAYVGNADIFTPKGLEEVVVATEKLQKYEFDFIASSPLWRARNTISPYLKATKQTAEVWSELKEAKGMLTILDKDLPEVEKEILNKGKSIEIPEDEQDYFKIRPGLEKHYKGAPSGSEDSLKVAYTKHVSLEIIKRLEAVYGKTGESDKSVLFAGHNSSGVSLLKTLIQFEPFGKVTKGLKNVSLWMVEQQKDGSYKLITFNDEPYEYKE